MLPPHLLAALELAEDAPRDEVGNLTPEGQAQVQAALGQAEDAEMQESDDQQRGQPDNAGQFGPGGPTKTKPSSVELSGSDQDSPEAGNSMSTEPYESTGHFNMRRWRDAYHPWQGEGGDGNSEAAWSRSLEGVSVRDLGADVKALRIQDAGKPMPKQSANMWTDDEEEMPGTSGYASVASALDDFLFGREESVTGENYTREVKAKPELWLLASDRKPIDAPGAETVVRDARCAGRFSRQQVFDALKQAIAVDHPAAAGAVDTEQLDEEYDWQDYAQDAIDILRDKLRSHLRLSRS